MKGTAINKRTEWIRSITVTAMFTAVMVVCSQIAIPMPGGIPITLQTFGMAMTAYCLGARRCLAAMAAYLTLGAVGVPVFASFGSGIGTLMGPTGGFLFGFLMMTAACGLAVSLFSGKGWKSVALGISGGAIGLTLCHLCGVVWYAHYAEIGLGCAFLLVSAPYLIKDSVSVVSAYLLANRISRIVGKQKN